VHKSDGTPLVPNLVLQFLCRKRPAILAIKPGKALAAGSLVFGGDSQQ